MYFPKIMRFTSTEIGIYLTTDNSGHLGRTPVDHRRLFMSNGQVPRPAVAPVGLPISEKNLFNCRSLKLGRDDLFFDSLLEWLHGKRVEFDSEVDFYCEHFPKAAVRFPCGKVVATVFDMCIHHRRSGFELVEVKCRADREPSRGTASWWQLAAQRALSEIWQVPYRIADEREICGNQLELDNIRRVVGMLPDEPDPILQRRVIALVRQLKGASIAEVAVALPHVDEDRVIRAVCSLLVEGRLDAPLAEQKFAKSLQLGAVDAPA